MLDSKNIIIAGISSDIGLALADYWAKRGHNVFGTYRKQTAELQALSSRLAGLAHCDFASNGSIDESLRDLSGLVDEWDALVICPATMVPIAPFELCDIDEWSGSFSVNFLSAARFMHGALQFRSKSGKPLVLNFAGGGSNSAPENVSAYVSSKIALTKLTELLAAECPSVDFAILGPGWVKTKIHDEMLASNSATDKQKAETKRRIVEGDFVPMDRVLFCCDWMLQSEAAISGRNFSAAHDALGSEELEVFLGSDEHLFKLRRHGNNETKGMK